MYRDVQCAQKTVRKRNIQRRSAKENAWMDVIRGQICVGWCGFKFFSGTIGPYMERSREMMTRTNTVYRFI